MEGEAIVVRAKVRCFEVARIQNRNHLKDGKYVDEFRYNAKFAFVGPEYGPDNKYVACAENTKFWEASPSGTLTMDYMKQDLYIPGQYYYLDFIPAQQGNA